MSSAAMRVAKERGEASANMLADLAEANELQRKSIQTLERLIRHGHKFIDLHVRKDGREYQFEADWLAPLLRHLSEKVKP